MSLEDLTEDELKERSKELENEKIRRENIETEKYNEILEKHKQAVFDNIDGLIACVPQHGRTSCNDENLNNYYECTCVRCTLLKMKDIGNNWDDITVSISVERREKRKKKKLKK